MTHPRALDRNWTSTEIEIARAIYERPVIHAYERRKRPFDVDAQGRTAREITGSLVNARAALKRLKELGIVNEWSRL